MKTLHMPQGSGEWEKARMGIVTASEADALLTPLFKVRASEGVETYMHRKICEKLLNWKPDTGSSFHMDQGNLIETIAIPWFAFNFNCDPIKVGFCVTDDGRCGCSPDSLLGDDNGLEVKAPTPPVHLKYLLAGVLPPEYAVQVHFSMYVTGRPKWTFLSYSRSFDPLIVHVERDPAIQDAIALAVNNFATKFDAALAKLKGKQDADNEARNAHYYATQTGQK